TSIKKCSKDPDSNSFLDEQGNHRTYLLPGEVTKLFPSCEILHHSERLWPIHQHGQGPKEQHSIIEAILKKQNAK
ncbi:MAG: hypothetical protein KKB51_06180, partial [Candidatus Riflebacteria bacterium]|nr:hypothetical protein [Candidatus Riflebacteria bacterium]